MPFEIIFTNRAKEVIGKLRSDQSLRKHLKAVNKALYYLENNPRHPGLNTHKYISMHGPNGEDIFEAYAENNTPAAYRIFWHYGPKKDNITTIDITYHP